MVLNIVDADTGRRSIGVLKQGGILVSIVGPAPADACRAANIRCLETGLVTGELLNDVVKLAGDGKLRVPVEQVLPLGDVVKAWDMNRARHTRGKLILDVSR